MQNYSDYIVVQAGGKGSRLEYLTRNRPKCLVPVENRPMIFHLFEQFPESHFLIIADAHFDVLEKYLKIFATVDYKLIRSTGNTGTLSGIDDAVSYVPDKTSFMIVWSDLILPGKLRFPLANDNYIGLGLGVRCRWKFEDGKISEDPSTTNGIVGLFLLRDKMEYFPCPKSGQLVKYFSIFEKTFTPFPISGIREFGLLAEYKKLPSPKCRPFNKITFGENEVLKESVTEQGKNLSEKELNWYKSLPDLENIPRIKSFTPFIMERILGETVAESRVDKKDRPIVLGRILDALRKLHAKSMIKADMESYYMTYFDKTMSRLGKIKNLVPFMDRPSLKINGKMARNVLFYARELKNLLSFYEPASFNVIHGDCTFSNLVLDPEKKVFFIDPRGYFGKTLLYGDSAYDYAKLYYSLVGNYDSFNKKKFDLSINPDGVNLIIESGGWEDLESDFFSSLPPPLDKKRIRLFHALIWLGLTTYAWEDYDAICGAFYNGTSLFEEALNEHGV